MRIGVVGTLVWDHIWGWGASAPVEAWGGITYSLAAAAAQAPPGWEIVPIVKVGEDLSAAALEFLGSLRQVRVDRVVRTSAPNNRVELRYVGPERRVERLTGGVPPWDAVELEQAVLGLDALYVNFISGREMELGVAEHIRRVFSGPIYGDLHSLLLDIAFDGTRSYRSLPGWERWVGCLDAVQLNEDELAALATGNEPWVFAEERLGPLVGHLFVTRGARGVWCRSSCGHDPAAGGSCGKERGLIQESASPEVRAGDPTGCGDVFGSSLFLALLAGVSPEEAVLRAQLAAASCVSVSGARRVYDLLSQRP